MLGCSIDLFSIHLFRQPRKEALHKKEDFIAQKIGKEWRGRSFANTSKSSLVPKIYVNPTPTWPYFLLSCNPLVPGLITLIEFSSHRRCVLEDKEGNGLIDLSSLSGSNPKRKIKIYHFVQSSKISPNFVGKKKNFEPICYKYKQCDRLSVKFLRVSKVRAKKMNCKWGMGPMSWTKRLLCWEWMTLTHYKQSRNLWYTSECIYIFI